MTKAVAPAPTPAPTMDRRNLAVRVASAAVFAALFLTLLWFGDAFASKVIFLGLLGAAAFVGAREMVLMGRKMGLRPSLTAATTVAWLFLGHFALEGGLFRAQDPLPLWLVLGAGLLVIHFGALLFDQDPIENALPSQAVAWMSGLVLGVGLGFQAKLFMLQSSLANTGSRLILALYLIVWFGDTLAYFAGHAFGKRKLAPKVSPKKTWEGFGGNLAGNILGALVAKLTVCPQWSPVDVVVLGLLAGLAGILGDLAESTWKRSAGVKDSAMGIEIPGHGGILDRLDSLFFAAPVVYAYIHFVHGLA